MKIPITLLLLIIFFNGKAQVIEGRVQGIKFEQDLNWAQIKEKAKKEKKYIFVDTILHGVGHVSKWQKKFLHKKK